MLFAARDEEAIAGLAILGIVAIAGLVVFILYQVSLMKALQACSPRNRTMTPGLVWLNLVPVLNLVWPFVTVIQIGKSLRREYEDRGTDRGGGYGTVTGVLVYTIGLLGGILGNGGVLFSMAVKGREGKELAALAALLTGLLGLVQFVLFLVYWVQVAGLTRGLTSARRPHYAYAD